jgi:hypothetical protein
MELPEFQSSEITTTGEQEFFGGGFDLEIVYKVFLIFVLFLLGNSPASEF